MESIFRKNFALAFLGIIFVAMWIFFDSISASAQAKTIIVRDVIHIKNNVGAKANSQNASSSKNITTGNATAQSSSETIMPNSTETKIILHAKAGGSSNTSAETNIQSVQSSNDVLPSPSENNDAQQTQTIPQENQAQNVDHTANTETTEILKPNIMSFFQEIIHNLQNMFHDL